MKNNKKKVRFSDENSIFFIETRHEIGAYNMNIHMNPFHYKYIHNEFQKELLSFLKIYPNFKPISNDHLIKTICDFVENLHT